MRIKEQTNESTIGYHTEWNTKIDHSGVLYVPNQFVKFFNNTTLYEQLVKNIYKLRIVQYNTDWDKLDHLGVEDYQNRNLIINGFL
jgi:hypothetical protein